MALGSLPAPFHAPGLLTSESGQGGGWPGVGVVMSPLPHQYLCPQIHPVSTTEVRVDKKRHKPITGSGRDSSRLSQPQFTNKPAAKRSQKRMSAGLLPVQPGARLAVPSSRAERRAGASLTSCSESVPDNFLSLLFVPIPPFFRLPLPGFRPLWEGTVHLPGRLPTLGHPQALWPWPSPLYASPWPHLRAPLSPSIWLSSPSPCMSGTDATKSFKKSNCCSSSMHCFLEEVRRGWHSRRAQTPKPSVGGSKGLRMSDWSSG